MRGWADSYFQGSVKTTSLRDFSQIGCQESMQNTLFRKKILSIDIGILNIQHQ